MRSAQIPVSVLLVFALVAPASAFDQRTEKTLMRLEPETRFHQICDIETMRRIKQAPGALKPDRMVMDAITPAVRAGDVLAGKGGAIRSRGDWYRLSFRCRASADRLKVLELSYVLGSKIPERDWERYGLWR